MTRWAWLLIIIVDHILEIVSDLMVLNENISGSICLFFNDIILYCGIECNIVL